jgi:hypothetical protein
MLVQSVVQSWEKAQKLRVFECRLLLLAAHHATTVSGSGRGKKRQRSSSDGSEESAGRPTAGRGKATSSTSGTFTLDGLTGAYNEMLEAMQPHKEEKAEMEEGDVLEQLQRLMDLRLIRKAAADPLASSGYASALSSEAACELRRRMNVVMEG